MWIKNQAAEDLSILKTTVDDPSRLDDDIPVLSVYEDEDDKIDGNLADGDHHYHIVANITDIENVESDRDVTNMSDESN